MCESTTTGVSSSPPGSPSPPQSARQRDATPPMPPPFPRRRDSMATTAVATALHRHCPGAFMPWIQQRRASKSVRSRPRCGTRQAPVWSWQAVTKRRRLDGAHGFGYEHAVALVRYDTRVRIHASYGCTIRIGYEEATRTGGGFFHGGVALNAEPDCGPGDYIDIIPEDWRMLGSGKKRLVFDHTCGIILVLRSDASASLTPAAGPPRFHRVRPAAAGNARTRAAALSFASRAPSPRRSSWDRPPWPSWPQVAGLCAAPHGSTSWSGSPFGRRDAHEVYERGAGYQMANSQTGIVTGIAVRVADPRRPSTWSVSRSCRAHGEMVNA